MNVSMQDGFNLGWKLAAVLEGRADSALVRTYSDERQTIAKDLIDFDRRWAAMISAPAKDASDVDGEGVTAEEVQRTFVESGRYTAGVATHYAPSLLTGGAEHQSLATGFPVGERFHSAPVTRVADAKLVELGHAARADGRWRIYAFADAVDIRDPRSRLARFCEDFVNDPARHCAGTPGRCGPRCRLRRAGRAAAASARDRVPRAAGAAAPVEGALRPRRLREGYSSLLHGDAEDIYARRGIDRESGALVVVRPTSTSPRCFRSMRSASSRTSSERSSPTFSRRSRSASADRARAAVQNPVVAIRLRR